MISWISRTACAATVLLECSVVVTTACDYMTGALGRHAVTFVVKMSFFLKPEGRFGTPTVSSLVGVTSMMMTTIHI